ncbi:hypothetical protein JYT14_00965 [Flavobacteriales bacterium AH-315-E23]|nr:hypothetical protein [Flavobacteriales bacterium AH-315-E23]
MKKTYWQIDVTKLAKAIRESAVKSISEEDLKMKVEPLLKRDFGKIGLDVHPDLLLSYKLERQTRK